MQHQTAALPMSPQIVTAHTSAQPGTFVGQAEERPSNLAQLIAILLSRKWTILAAAAVAVTGTFLVLGAISPRYVAQTTVVVGARMPQVVALSPVMSSLEISPFSHQAQVETEVQMLRSRGLAEQLVNRLGLLEDPEFNPILADRQERELPAWLPHWITQFISAIPQWLGRQPRPDDITRADEVSAVLDVLARRVSVEPIGRSTALAVFAASNDPEKAALIANTLSQLYVNASRENKVAATERALASLRDRISELQHNVVSAERTVERYRIEAGLIDRDDATTPARHIAEIRSQLVLAQAQSASAGARLAQLRESRGSIAGSADVLASPTIHRLREQEAIIDRELQDVQTRFGSRHPETIGKRGALEAVRARIRDEINRVAASLDAEVRIAQDREAALRRDLAEAEQEAGQRNEAAVRLRELRREADAGRRLYDTFLQRYQEVSQQVGLQQSDAEIISAARAPERAAWPPKLLFLGLAGIGTTVASSLWVVLRELRRGSLHDSDGVQEVLQMPTMALVPRLGALRRIRGAPEDPLLDDTDSAFAESIQLIRVQIGRLAPGRSGRVVMFTSATGGEGKTSVATACARMAARAGESVVVIDCDMRRSRVERIFGKARYGLADVLTGRCALEDALTIDRATGLSFIASHPRRGAMPMDLLGGEAMEALLRRLVENFDLIVLDTPPVLAVADALAVAPLADLTLLVVDAERTPRQVVRSALKLLVQAGIDVGGVILSKVSARCLHSYGYRNGTAAEPMTSESV